MESQKRSATPIKNKPPEARRRNLRTPQKTRTTGPPARRGRRGRRRPICVRSRPRLGRKRKPGSPRPRPRSGSMSSGKRPDAATTAADSRESGGFGLGVHAPEKLGHVLGGKAYFLKDLLGAGPAEVFPPGFE